jgi:hypothetical protein
MLAVLQQPQKMLVQAAVAQVQQEIRLQLLTLAAVVEMDQRHPLAVVL